MTVTTGSFIRFWRLMEPRATLSAQQMDRLAALDLDCWFRVDCVDKKTA